MCVFFFLFHRSGPCCFVGPALGPMTISKIELSEPMGSDQPPRAA